MRTIKFKAKRIDNGEWVVGFYYNANATLCIEGFHLEPYKVDTHYILQFETPDTAGWEMEMQTNFIEIDPKTVCQFTGLFDKNGHSVYEGDILNVIGWGKKPDILGESFIEWDEEENAWNIHNLLIEDRYDFRRCFPNSTITGNIHDK